MKNKTFTKIFSLLLIAVLFTACSTSTDPGSASSTSSMSGPDQISSSSTSIQYNQEELLAITETIVALGRSASTNAPLAFTAEDLSEESFLFIAAYLVNAKTGTTQYATNDADPPMGSYLLSKVAAQQIALEVFGNNHFDSTLHYDEEQQVYDIDSLTLSRSYSYTLIPETIVINMENTNADDTIVSIQTDILQNGHALDEEEMGTYIIRFKLSEENGITKYQFLDITTV